MANGWLEDKEQQFYIGIRALEKRRTKCIILVAGVYVEKRQNDVRIS